MAKKITDYQIVMRGQTRVNIPAVLIILIVWYSLVCLTTINFKVCVLIATACGWIYWEFAINKWISWAIDLQVDPKRLGRIGIRNLLLWSEFRINNVIEKKNS